MNRPISNASETFRQLLFGALLTLFTAGGTSAAYAHEKGYELEHPNGGSSAIWLDPQNIQDEISVIAGTSVELIGESVNQGMFEWQKVKVLEGRRQGQVGWTPIGHLHFR